MSILTDLIAAKVGRFTDLGVVLVEYYRVKSFNGLKHTSFTRVLGNSQLLIPAFKVGLFNDLLADF